MKNIFSHCSFHFNYKFHIVFICCGLIFYFLFPKLFPKKSMMLKERKHLLSEEFLSSVSSTISGISFEEEQLVFLEKESTYSKNISFLPFFSDEPIVEIACCFYFTHNSNRKYKVYLRKEENMDLEILQIGVYEKNKFIMLYENEQYEYRNGRFKRK